MSVHAETGTLESPHPQLYNLLHSLNTNNFDNITPSTTPQETLRVWSWNTQKKPLEGFLDEAEKHNVDVVLFQEVIRRAPARSNWWIHYNEGRAARGVAVALTRRLQPLLCESGKSLANDFAYVGLAVPTGVIRIASCYGTIRNGNYKELGAEIDALLAKEKQGDVTIAGGDFNTIIRAEDYGGEATAPARNPWIMEALNSQRLLDPWLITANRHLRFTRLQARLDFFLGSPSMLALQPLAEILPLELSDHRPVVLSICCLPVHPTHYRKRYLQRLSQEDWTSIRDNLNGALQRVQTSCVWEKLRQLEHYLRENTTCTTIARSHHQRQQRVTTPFVSRRDINAARGQARIDMSFVKDHTGRLLFDKNDIALALERHLLLQTPPNQCMHETLRDMVAHAPRLPGEALPAYTLTDLEHACKTAKPKKSLGPEGVNLYVLKNLPATAKLIYVEAVNMALSTGHVPCTWTISALTMVYKRGDPCLLGSYRPIAVSCVLSRLIAQHIRLHLEAQIDKAGYLLPYQCGFRRGRSTFEVAANVMTSLHHKSNITALVDISKAFDSVHWANVSLLLEALGVDITFILGLRSIYGNACNTCVGLQGRQVPVAGTRQGCVLSPLLFNIWLALAFHNCRPPKDVSVGVFADDITISTGRPDSLQNYLAHLHKALNSIGLHISVEKCILYYRGSAPAITLGGIGVPSVRAVAPFKVLGHFVAVQDSCIVEACRSEIIRFFDEIPAEALGMNAWISATNNFLIPRVVHRSLTLVDATLLHNLDTCIWNLVSAKAKLPRLRTPPHQAYWPVSHGGLGLHRLSRQAAVRRPSLWHDILNRECPVDISVLPKTLKTWISSAATILGCTLGRTPRQSLLRDPSPSPPTGVSIVRHWHGVGMEIQDSPLLDDAVYTDGSLRENVGGWSVCLPDGRGFVGSLNNVKSSFEVEIAAVAYALFFVSKTSALTIKCDNASAVAATRAILESGATGNNVWEYAIHKLATQRSPSVLTAIHWVKGHSGSQGNTRADGWARFGSGLPAPFTHILPVPHNTDLLLHIGHRPIAVNAKGLLFSDQKLQLLCKEFELNASFKQKQVGVPAHWAHLHGFVFHQGTYPLDTRAHPCAYCAGVHAQDFFSMVATCTSTLWRAKREKLDNVFTDKLAVSAWLQAVPLQLQRQHYMGLVHKSLASLINLVPADHLKVLHKTLPL